MAGTPSVGSAGSQESGKVSGEEVVMRVSLRALAAVLALATLAVPATESMAALKARANELRGGDQAKACMEYAHRLLEEANGLFTKGDVDAAQAEIREVVEYAKKGAHAA